MIFVHLKAHLSVEVARDVIEVEISFEVPLYCTPAVSSLIVFLVATIKLILYTICTVSFFMFPSYSSFFLRSYTLVDLIRQPYSVLILGLCTAHFHDYRPCKRGRTLRVDNHNKSDDIDEELSIKEAHFLYLL
jgi:hypothetical protein